MTIVNTGSLLSSVDGIEDFVPANGSYGHSIISNGTAAGPNSAVITASRYGVLLDASDVLNNYAGATISGGTDSVYFGRTNATANNYGVLNGNISFAASNGLFNNYGTVNGNISVASGIGYGGAINLYAGSTTNGIVDTSASSQANAVTVYTGTAMAPAAVFGTLKGGVSSDLYLAGGGDGTAGNGAAGTLDPNAVTGFGAVVQSGSGLWKITASDAGFAIPMTVNAGTLQVDGSIPNAGIRVNAGGTLTGTGSVGTTTVTGATLAPGVGGIGTLTVAGNLSLDSGSTYAVDVAPGSAEETVRYRHRRHCRHGPSVLCRRRLCCGPIHADLGDRRRHRHVQQPHGRERHSRRLCRQPQLRCRRCVPEPDQQCRLCLERHTRLRRFQYGRELAGRRRARAPRTQQSSAPPPVPPSPSPRRSRSRTSSSMPAHRPIASPSPAAPPARRR